MTQPTVPTVEQVIAPAIDRLYELRPRAYGHLEKGRYGDVIHGWAGQVRVMRAELAQLVASRRVATASGEDLRTLARSDEFGAVINDVPSKALGRLTLQRQQQTASSAIPFAAGVIPRGSRFRIKANRAATPPVTESSAEAIVSVVVGNTADSLTTAQDIGGGQWLHTQFVPVPVRAIEAGAGSNVLDFNTAYAVEAEPTSQLFDTFTVAEARLSGGSSGLSEESIRRAATAAYIGRHAPTNRALIMGAYAAGLGVERIALADDPDNGAVNLFPADISWASTAEWRAALIKSLRDGGWIGFGCKVGTRPVVNKRVYITVDVKLKEQSFGEDTTDLTQAIEKSVRSYLDDRQDFWTFRLRAIAGAVANADRRKIQAVPSLLVVLGTNGQVVTEPDTDPLNSAQIFHHFLESLKITYYGPNGTAL